MLNSCEVTDIFYLCDEFFTEFKAYYPKRALREDNSKKNTALSLVVYLIAK